MKLATLKIVFQPLVLRLPLFGNLNVSFALNWHRLEWTQSTGEATKWDIRDINTVKPYIYRAGILVSVGCFFYLLWNYKSKTNGP